MSEQERGEGLPATVEFKPAFSELGLLEDGAMSELWLAANPELEQVEKVRIMAEFADAARAAADALEGPDHRLIDLGVLVAEAGLRHRLGMAESAQEAFDDTNGILDCAYMYVQAGVLTEESYGKLATLASQIG